MEQERMPLWRRKSIWAVALGVVAAGGVVIGGLTIEDAAAIIEAVAGIIGSIG